MPTEHFKTAEDYQKWNAYRHIHGIPAPHLKTAVVAGVAHKVKHSALSSHAQGLISKSRRTGSRSPRRSK